MAFIRKKGKTKIAYMPVTVSTALSANSLVAFSSGYLIAATSTTAPSAIAGVLLKAIAATDADYAVARVVAVEVPVEKNVQWEAAVTSGLAATSVGVFYDLTNASTVNTGATTYDPVKCTKYISATKGWFELNIGTDGIAGK
jgi:hypothetical protein